MKNNKLVYVVCPDRKKPIGGVKQLYRLVDTLNQAGYNAFVIHGKQNFRVTWFENETPIRYFPYLSALLYRERKKKKLLKVPLFVKRLLVSGKMPEKESIIVFPEVYGANLNRLVPENEIVIFNQNCYYTFDNFALLEKSASPYTHPKTLGCIVVSQDSVNYMNYAFPSLATFRIRLGLSPCFDFSGNKKKQIAFMPRKLVEDFKQLFHILADRIDLNAWEFVAIDNMHEHEVAKALKESAIFLSFNHQEGFGLPPVEAMACGCYVIGYTGHAGAEYFDPSFCSPIATRNVIEFAKEVEHIVHTYDQNSFPILEKGRKASAYVLDKYTMTNETKDIIDTWNEILRK
jgi:glycosyltransferase involved in cell wall biosynthesis